jgi:hypothetical protein
MSRREEDQHDLAREFERQDGLDERDHGKRFGGGCMRVVLINEIEDHLSYLTEVGETSHLDHPLVRAYEQGTELDRNDLQTVHSVLKGACDAYGCD